MSFPQFTKKELKFGNIHHKKNEQTISCTKFQNNNAKS